ncbi:hypothetical protein [Mycobacterium sp.]
MPQSCADFSATFGRVALPNGAAYAATKRARYWQHVTPRVGPTN